VVGDARSRDRWKLRWKERLSDPACDCEPEQRALRVTAADEVAGDRTDDVEDDLAGIADG
jgi:hypothetical protein